MSTPVMGYWDIRGLAEPIRYLLHYKGIKFEDRRYLTEESWQKDKFKLNLDFPNLPYYIDDDVKLTQSLAILRYLAKKYNLGGKTDEERLRVDLAEQQISDLRVHLGRVSYNPEFEKLKADFVQSVPAQMKLFSDFLGDRKFVAGNSVTYVDFMVYDVFDFYRLLIPTVLHEFPNLKEYEDRMENLPELKKYFQSSTYRRWPIFLPRATFGGKGPEPRRA